VKRRINSRTSRSFVSAVSEAWADCRNASRIMVERQMGPQRRHNHR
jgi:hypothetical protein